MSETQLCGACEGEYPLSQLKPDNYRSETLFCKECYSYNIECAICKNRAVSCWFNRETSERGFDDDENECAIFEVRSCLRIFEYTKISYETNNPIDGCYSKAICDCFICGRFVCVNCFDTVSSSLYSYSDENHTLCEQCNDKYIGISEKPSEMVVLRKYKHEKAKRRKLEDKLSHLEIKLAVKETLTIFPSAVTDLICEYL